MDRLRSDDRGSVLVMATIAMLVLAVLGVSFALLANIETSIGINYKQQAQAEALAEAGLERARDAVRDAASASCGFTKYFPGGDLTGCADTASPLGLTNVSLGAGQYSAVMSNNCSPLVPTGIADGGASCNTARDNDETAVVTAWAEAGHGRARVRAILAVDNPWKHVCSNASEDNPPGYCNEAANRNGNPSVTPADPNDPNGPAAYDDLPRPILGCSRIAPGLHAGPYAVAAQEAGCTANPQMYGYPYPVAPNVVPRFVLMGEDPALVATAKKCNVDPGNAGNYYFGYFDCALSTWCDPNAPFNMPCGNLGLRKACVRAGDTRLASDPAHYVAYDNNPASPNYGKCGTGATDETGMVAMPQNNQGQTFGGSVAWNQNLGSQSRQFTVYVLGSLSTGNNRQYYGTLAVEGNTVNNPCSDKDFVVGNGAASALWAGPNAAGPPVGWTFTNQYGFPLAVLVYNPTLAAPTVTPTYAPQGTCADMGSANSQVHGMVYSGGHLEFNPLSMDGSAVAFEIQTQGSASYVYNTYYGNNVPPPGFPNGSGNQVVVVRRSFITCNHYAPDSTTSCN